jgi:hypothetical protein
MSRTRTVLTEAAEKLLTEERGATKTGAVLLAEDTRGDVSFNVIKRAVAKQFEKMSKHGLYRVDLSGASSEALLMAHATGGAGGLSSDQRRAATGDLLWSAYLAAFPAGTNPIYKERADHDCSCCKHFIKTMGAVVAIVDGYVVSLWNFEPTGTFYDEVAAAMDHLVRSAAIDNIFLHNERTVGADKSFQQYLDAGAVDAALRPGRTDIKTWDHFFVNLPDSVVVKKDAIGPTLADARATHDVFKRGLEEITLDALDTVLELIAQNSLYRGEEHRHTVKAFRRLKVQFDGEGPVETLALNGSLRGQSQDIYAWHGARAATATNRIRNTSIGTLLLDLSNGVDMEEAVRKFEAMVAPANYKRPTALVTKAMIAKAQAKIEELGYTSSLERRYAVIEDITINNVLYADRSVKICHGARRGGKTASAAFAELAESVPVCMKNLDRVEEVGVEKFLANVLPTARSIEVLLENRHKGNFVSLIAPVDPTAKHVFKWPNNFSWSYAGDVADSIKERVKRAGGSVTGDLCCRLAWDYTDDLDFHMKELGRTKVSGERYVGGAMGPFEIFFANRRTLSPNGGMLDLDANGADGLVAQPAENIFYANKGTMAEGVYELSVNNFSRRSSDGRGFEVEIEFDGVTHNFVYEKALRTGERIIVATVTYSKTKGFEVKAHLPSTQASKTVWGLKTQTFQKVAAVMLSPNYWTEADDSGPFSKATGKHNFDGVGNKHWFFMLEGARNEERARPFFNEFLGSELDRHRKVMEMVGAKMRTEESDRQLSGLGFSSTQRASLTVRVNGAFNRLVKVVF